MASRRRSFYADEDDLLHLLCLFRCLQDYKYVQMRSELNKENKIFFDPVEILPSAIVTPSRPYLVNSYMVVKKDVKLSSRKIERADGSGTLTIISQSQNHVSISLGLGGNAGDKTLLASELGSIESSQAVKNIYNEFDNIIISNTKKLGHKGSPYRLMPGSIAKLSEGWRLTQGKERIRELDVKIPPHQLGTFCNL